MGTTLSSGGASFADAKAACDANKQCTGLTYDAASRWRLFSAELREAAIGKYKAIGESIDSWLAAPTGDEQTPEWTATCMGNSVGGANGLNSTGTTAALLALP